VATARETGTVAEAARPTTSDLVGFRHGGRGCRGRGLLGLMHRSRWRRRWGRDGLLALPGRRRRCRRGFGASRRSATAAGGGRPAPPLALEPRPLERRIPVPDLLERFLQTVVDVAAAVAPRPPVAAAHRSDLDVVGVRELLGQIGGVLMVAAPDGVLVGAADGGAGAPAARTRRGGPTGDRARL